MDILKSTGRIGASMLEKDCLSPGMAVQEAANLEL